MRRLAKWGAALLVLAASAIPLASLVPLDPARFARPPESIVVTDRNGTVLRIVREGGVDHRWVSLADVSPHYLDAVVAAEDVRFAEHPGVDPKALARALASPFLPGRRLSGGSTLAQQTIKLTHGRRGGLFAKPLEMARALALVRLRSRAQVLEEYVNRLPFGHGIVGIERASEVYFGKPARALDLAEAALLAGIPQAPSATEPIGHRARALARRSYVLDRLAVAGRRSPSEVEAARRAPLVLATMRPHPYLAPRFVERALRTHASEASSGLLRTTLDVRAQRSLESILARATSVAETTGASNACGLVLAVESGEVLAYVGAARASIEAEGGAIDLVARRRHPGSTLKPFVYAKLFEAGSTPSSWLEDRPRAMTGADGSPYDAENFDGIARGRVHAREALAASLNLAALDAARRVGAEPLATTFARLGLPVVDGATHGVGLALGGVSVSPYELARAYLALAQGGERIEPTFVARGATHAGARVLDASAAALVTDVLRDPIARRTGFGSDLASLAASGAFALKTGTSPEGRDAWAAVYDERFVVVVWVGDPSGRPSRGLTGFANAAPHAVRAIEALRTAALPSDPKAPDTRAASALAAMTGERAPSSASSLAHVRVCAITGGLAGPSCPARLEPAGATAVPRPCAGHAHEAPPRVAAVRIVEPRDGARFLVDQARAIPVVPVRIEGRRARLYVDGRLARDGRLRLDPGAHRLRAVDANGREAEATIVVEPLRGQT